MFEIWLAFFRPSSEVNGGLLGFDAGDLTYTIMLESWNDFCTYEIQKDLICTALDCGSADLDTTLQEKIPISCQLVLSEGNVSSLVLL